MAGAFDPLDDGTENVTVTAKRLPSYARDGVSALPVIGPLWDDIRTGALAQKANLEDAGAGAAQTFGAFDLRDRALAASQADRAAAGALDRPSDITQATGPMDALKRGWSGFVQSSPQVATTLGAAGAGFLGGETLFPAGGGLPGALLAAGAVNFPGRFGQNIREQVDQGVSPSNLGPGRAAAAAVPMAALDSLLTVLMPGGLAKPLTGGVIPRAVQGAIEQAAMNAPAATLQEALAIFQANPDLGKMFQPETLKRLASVAANAGVVAAPIGAAGRVAQGRGPGSMVAAGTAESPVHATDTADLQAARDRVNLNPTEGQKETGRYQKGYATIGDPKDPLDVVIENPIHSERSGVAPDGTPWKSKLPADYGYVPKTEGADGEPVDVYIGPHTRSKKVFVIDQKDPATGAFDEHKAMIGYPTQDHAIADYARAFDDGSGLSRIGGIREMPFDTFKLWAKEGDTTQPASHAELPKTIADIHALADEKGIKYDGDPEFMATSKQLTGKEHLDDMSAPQLAKVYNALDAIGKNDSLKDVGTERERNTPEAPQTLAEQQRALVEGRRPVQMFPTGTEPLPLPPGMQSIETPRGVFHYDPEKMSPGRIKLASDVGRENDILGLGPMSKRDVINSGEQPMTIVERDPQGQEVTSALTTPSKQAETLAAMQAHAAPGHTVAAEPVENAIAGRPGAPQMSGQKPLQYPLADRNEWYGDANYRETGGNMKMMTPDEFLSRARPLTIDDASRDNIDALKQHIQSGGTLDPLAFHQTGMEDGRHRAIAAKELGIDKVPVLTWDGQKYTAQPADAPKDPFFSSVERYIDNSPQKKASADQWKAMLRAAPGVRDDELTWSGINDFLSSAKGPITKEALLDHMKENGVKVNEIWKTGSPDDSIEFNHGDWEAEDPDPEYMKERALEEIDEHRADLAHKQGVDEGEISDKDALEHGIEAQERWHYQDPDRPELKTVEVRDNGKTHTFQVSYNGGDTQIWHLEGNNEVPISVRGRPDEADIDGAIREYMRSNNLLKSGGEQTEYEGYVLPGGKNYRELLMTLPQRGRLPEGYTTEKNARGTWTIMDPNGLFVSDGWKTEDAAVHSMRRISDGYQSGHWEEPNVAAHIRMNDRTGPNGEKILHLEEIQSDWHQEGREAGYKDATYTDRMNKITNDIRDLQYQRNVAKRLLEINPDHKDAGREWEEANSAIEQKLEEKKQLGNAVSDAPFKKNWQELAFKRALREAVESGADKMTWTTGTQQNQRWGLSNHIKSIMPDAVLPDGTRNVVMDSKAGRMIQVKIDSSGNVIQSAWNGDSLVGKKLSDIVGKEMAEKITSSPGLHKIEGNGLEVGGEGMRGFYDKILHDFAKKYGKKFGATVGRTPIQVDMEGMRGAAIYPREVVQRGPNWSIADNSGEFHGLFGSHDDAMNAMEKLKKNPYALAHTMDVHSIDITPEMRASIMQGQPMFTGARADAPAQAIHNSLVEDLTSIINRITNGQAKAKFNDQMFGGGRNMELSGGGAGWREIAGRYTPNNRIPLESLIEVSLDPKFDPQKAATHESWHWIKDNGVFTDRQNAALRNNRESLQHMVKAEGLDWTHMSDEEIEATAFARWWRLQKEGGNPTGIAPALRNAFNKAIQFFNDFSTRVHRYGPTALSKITGMSHEDVFRSVARGRNVTRPASAFPGRLGAPAVTPTASPGPSQQQQQQGAFQ